MAKVELAKRIRHCEIQCLLAKKAKTQCQQIRECEQNTKLGPAKDGSVACDARELPDYETVLHGLLNALLQPQIYWNTCLINYRSFINLRSLR
ncbi:hypothetical protein L596_003448 [Steinernema carpocapsae]|uniref:Uncharacterized protein n=1 Tax=Steinernema carpocapsae TaxID=34508 RepID=A0A4V6I7R5_STECR|nr:hypothetical protein L596_003448 [Steinernema carpocapsae]